MLDFITGPLFIISIAVFVVGMLVRAVLYVRGLDARLERVAYSYHTERSIPGALASIFKWLIPGGTSRLPPFFSFFCISALCLYLCFFLGTRFCLKPMWA